MKIIIPANEVKVGDYFLVTNNLHEYSYAWIQWLKGGSCPRFDDLRVIWSREIDPWVSVEERLPKLDYFCLVQTATGEQWARYNFLKKCWTDCIGNPLLHQPTHWLDTSLFPVPPKRDECEKECREAFDKWINEEPGTITTTPAYDAWQAAWKAARGTR